jgi:hypothetical protein
LNGISFSLVIVAGHRVLLTLTGLWLRILAAILAGILAAACAELMRCHTRA